MLYAPSITSPDVDEDELADLLAGRNVLDDDEMKALLERIQPIVRGGDKKFRVAVTDPHEDYLDRPHLLAEEVIEPDERCEIVTLHPYRECYRLFCPTPADVFAMMTPEMKASARYFEIICRPESEDDLAHQMSAVRAGYHAATTVIYF